MCQSMKVNNYNLDYRKFQDNKQKYWTCSENTRILGSRVIHYAEQIISFSER